MEFARAFDIITDIMKTKILKVIINPISLGIKPILPAAAPIVAAATPIIKASKGKKRQ